MSVLVVVSDLVFKEKIAAAGRELSVELLFARTLTKARTVAQERRCQDCLVDLHLKGEDPIEIGTALKEEGLVERVHAFFSHVEVEKEDDALLAGFDEVLPRSKFFARLPDILSQAVRDEG